MSIAQQTYFYQLIEKSSRCGIPLSVLIELTNRCNLKCSHCYVVKDDEREELTTDRIYRLFDRLADEGCMFLTLSGGEIFLKNDILDIAAYARSKGFVLTLFTNGTLIDKYIAARLADLYLEAVEISLYSMDANVHDKITGVKGSHVATLRAIHILSKKEVPVTIKSPLMKENLKNYKDIIRFAKGLDLKCIFDPFITPRADGDMIPISMRLNSHEAALCLREMGMTLLPSPTSKDREKRGKDDGVEITDSYEPLALEEEVCAMGRRTCVISPTGDVFPCLLFPTSAGNIREKNFREIWRGSHLFNYLRSLTLSDLKEACSTCKKLDYCQRCSPVALMEDGDLLGPSSWSCNMAEAIELGDNPQGLE